jgi:hypothetical protein
MANAISENLRKREPISWSFHAGATDFYVWREDIMKNALDNVFSLNLCD